MRETRRTCSSVPSESQQGCAQCPMPLRLLEIETRLRNIEMMLHRSLHSSHQRSPPQTIGQQGRVDVVSEDRPSTQKDHQP